MTSGVHPLLEVTQLTLSFSLLSKKVYAVQEVSFALKEGETLGIVGESGCGKSTLARTLIGLLPPYSAQIESGSILYKGEELLTKERREMERIRGKEIGMIFQDPMTSLNPTMTIGRQIVEGYAHHYPKSSKKERMERALDLLKCVGISEPKTRFKHYPHELSGGLRQRVMIAIAVITSPSLLIADEPTTALDVTIQAQILCLLKEIKEKENTSILLITHNLGIVAGFCDRILVMYAGKIVESAPTAELFHSPKHPYTRRLLESIPRLDQEPQGQLRTVEGRPPNLTEVGVGCSFAPRCHRSQSRCYRETPILRSLSPSRELSCYFPEEEIQ